MPNESVHVRHGIGAVRPYICGPVELLDFVKATFDAVELERHEFGPESFHVEMRIGDSVVVIEAGELPPDVSSWTCAVYVYVEDVDAVYDRALNLGARGIAPPQDKPYRERQAGFADAAGNTWWIATYGRSQERVEDPTRGRASDAPEKQPRVDSLRSRFSELHAAGTFVMPNAWDIGSARILTSLGFSAIATTSSGHAASLGRMDQQVTLEELLEHVEALVRAVDVPLNVDAERCFADDPKGVAATVERLAEKGAAGVSIEDYDPGSGIEPTSVMVHRVAAAATAARARGVVLTARAENHLYGIDDLDDTIARLRAYRDAGADVVYAPGLVDLDAIARVVDDVGIPVNVLARPNGPSVGELATAGVRRVSTGGSLAFAAYGALAASARELLSSGTSTYASRALSAEDRRKAFEG